MDFKELQDLLRREKSKIIIIENGEPIMVILPYEEYKKQMSETLEEPFQNEPPAPPQDENADQEELTIDDLPL